jgi:hypothetical protein
MISLTLASALANHINAYTGLQRVKRVDFVFDSDVRTSGGIKNTILSYATSHSEHKANIAVSLLRDRIDHNIEALVREEMEAAMRELHFPLDVEVSDIAIASTIDGTINRTFMAVAYKEGVDATFIIIVSGLVAK